MPHSDTYECRQFIHQLMQTFGKNARARPLDMVGDRSATHPAKALQSTLQDYRGRFRMYMLRVRAGHHLNPIDGFWRVMKNTVGGGWCFSDLHALSQRTRRLLLTHQEQPICRSAWP